MQYYMYLSLADASNVCYAIFGLVIFSAALIGFGWQGNFFSHILPDVFVRVVYLPSFSLFIFTMCISNTLAFWIILDDSAIFLGVPLSILFSRCFPEEAPKLSENFLSLSISTRAAEVFLPPFILSGIRSCLRVFDFWALVWRRFWGILLVPHLPLMKGAPKKPKGMLRSCKWCSRKYSPCLMFTFSLMKNISMGCFPYLWQYFWWCCIYSCFIRRRG